jgi:DnaJ-class molecular chaperone
MKNVEFIRHPESDKECIDCRGTGEIYHKNRPCKSCDGTGIYKDNRYTMVATDKNGNKIAFNVDGIK